MAVGISMVIDDKFLERLSAADGKLEELAKKSEEVRGRIVTSFRSMGDDGVSYFIQKINEAKAALQGMGKEGGKISIDAKGIEVVGTSATKSADEVNKLIDIVSKLAEANQKIAGKKVNTSAPVKNEGVDALKTLEQQYDTLNIKLEEYRKKLLSLSAEQRKSMQTGQFRQGLGEDIAKTTQEAEALMVRMQNLRRNIEGLKQGNTGFIDMANSIGKTNSELAAMNKFYADQERAQQQVIETERKSLELKEQAAKKASEENQRVKESSEAQKKAFDERVKVWEQGFDKYDKMLQTQKEKETKEAERRIQEELRAEERARKEYERLQKEQAKIAERSAKEYEDRKKKEAQIAEKYQQEQKRAEEQANKEFDRIQKERAAIAERRAKEYESAWLKADADLTKSSEQRMRQVLEQINKEEEARRKSIQSQQASQATRTTTSYLAEYNYNAKRIEELNANMQKLIASTKQYELIKSRIESGKGGVLTKQQTDEYNANIKNIDAIKQQIVSYQQRNQAIINENQAIQAQIRFKQELQNMTQKDRESAEILAKMNAYYRDQADAADMAAKKAKELISAFKTSYQGAMIGSMKADTYEKERAAIENLQIARANLSQNDADFAAKRNALNEAINKHMESLKKSGMTDAQIAEEAAKASEKRRQAALEEAAAYEKRKKLVMDKWYSSSADRALNFSASTKSINEQIQAIKYLQIARANLSKGNMTDEQYRQKVKQITEEIKRQQTEVDKLVGKNRELATSHRNLMDLSGQLARKLALVFSVSQIQGYISKLVSVRGEFELQQKSLQVLLQNRDEANKLWQQTVELAVKSPFRVSELVSYTRQLAAYRIETSKLHETTRKLADVSAGLGVDMNRLILAYGQVRAAEYLRGTELRQFTEAGIPMLDELAKRFSELEGRAVSAGDVFERISKRMVGFEDVAAVFDKMTSAGGTFYKMQEEQSETLKGMISNFRDSVDIMLNDIGKSNEGLLKGTVNVARVLVEQWQTLAVILKSLITLIAIYRGGMVLTSQKMIESAVNAGVVNGALTKQITLTQLAKLGWAKLSSAVTTAGTVFKASLPLMAATAVMAGIMELISTFREHSAQLEEISKKYAKLRDQLTEISYAFNNAVDEKDIQMQRQKLETLISLANNEYHMKIKVDLTGATEEDIQKMFLELQTRLTEVNAYANMFETAMQKSTEWNWSDLFDKTKNLSEVIQNAYSTLAANVASDVNGLRDNFDELSESEKAAFEILKQPKKVDETDVEYLQRLNNGYSTLISSAQEAIEVRDQYSTQSKEYRKANEEVLKIWNRLAKSGIDYNQIRKALAAQDKAQTAAQEEYNEALDKSAELFKALENIPDKEKEIRLTAAIDKVASEKHWDDFVKYDIMRWTEQRFNIKFNFVPDEKKPRSVWQENYNKQFESYYGYKKIENADTTREKELQRINGFLKEQKDLVERIQKAGTRKGTAYEGYNLDEEKRKLEDLKKQVEWFGIGDKTTKGRGKDWFSELAKNIKDAHKEFVTLNKDLDEAAATTLMLERYSGVIHESLAALNGQIGDYDISQYDLTTEEGTIQALNDLLNIIPDTAKEAQLAVQKALSDIIGEQTIRSAQQDTKNLIDGIKDMIDGYKLSLELDTMGVPQNLASQLFGIQTFSLEDIKQRIAAEKAADKAISTERLKQLNDLEIQIADMEDKARMERLKKYTNYLIAAQSEAVKIKLEEARKIAEIESMAEMTPAQKEIAKGAVREETQKQLDKQQWEDFKNTDLYIELFEDLDNVSTNTLNRMKAKLVEMRDSLKNLDPAQLKEIAKRIDDVNKALVSKNPFKGIVKGIKNAVKSYKDYQKAADKALASQQDVDSQQKVVDNLQLQVEEQRKVVYEKQNSSDVSIAEQAVEQAYLSQLENELATQKKILKEKKDKNNESQEEKQNAKEILGLTKDQLSKSAQQLNEGYAAFTDLTDTLQTMFGSFDESTQDFLENVGSVVEGISQIESGLSQILDGKVITGALNMVTGVFKTIGGLFGFGNHDKRRERQIQKEMKLVTDLQHAYEKLEKAIDDAYAIDTLERSTKNAKANLQAQIASYNKMIAAEEAKKNTDDERIKEWRYAIEDLREQIKELDEQAFNEATGNILDNVLNAATEFTDAWLEAFKETGNGLTGLEDNFKEAVTNMLKQQASMLITSSYIDKWKKNLEKYINTDDLELTSIEAKQWVEDVKNTLPQLNNALKEYFNAMKGAGIDLGGNYEMSSLQRGLQSMTEDTAQILASYLNSVRFYVAEQNTLLQNIAASLGASTIENPMVEQLKIIASQTTAINSLLQSCTKGGHRLGGMGLKIFMD